MLFAQAALGTLCFGALLLLPGLGVLSTWHRPRGRRGDGGLDLADSMSLHLALGVGLSLCLVMVAGFALLATHTFTDVRLALVMGVLAVPGLLPLARVVQRARGSWWLAASLGLLALPFLWPALRPGYAPVNNFNWYYWSLGRDLSRVGGIPAWVTEYGGHVRWQPDYLSFNLLTEGFRGLLVGASDVDALSVWKVPVALFTVCVCFAMLRLWFGRPSAFVGTALLLVTTLFSAKLGNARPEILGFDLGLVAVIIGVQAQRRLLAYAYLLAAVVLAIASSVHAIGALVGGVLLAMGTLCEIARARGHRGRRVGIGLGGLAAFVLVVIATGWSLQGRAFVGANAANPHSIAGSDPTLTFFKLTEGLHHRPAVATRLVGQLLHVTEAASLSRPEGVLVGVLLIVSLLAALVLGPLGARQAAVIALGLTVFLAAGAAWFAVRYSTFVPQNTGLSRLTQWSPVAFVLALTSGLEAVSQRLAPAWRDRRTGSRHVGLGRGRRPLAVVAVLTLSAAWSLVILRDLPSPTPLAPPAATAIQQVRRTVPTGDVLLSNMTTHGLVEFLTGAEVPVEGRQPVIENESVLEASNRYLQRVTDFYTHPRATDPRNTFHAQWILVTDEPEAFGADRTFGPPRDRLPRLPGLTEEWSNEHIALYRVAPERSPEQQLGPPRVVLVRSATALIVVVLGLWGLSRLLRRRQRASDSDDAPPVRVATGTSSGQ